MNVLAVLAKLAGTACLMAALLGAWAHGLDEPRRGHLIGRTRWFVLLGYIGVMLWAALVWAGIVAWGCDPLFGGFARAPASRLYACRW